MLVYDTIVADQSGTGPQMAVAPLDHASAAAAGDGPMLSVAGLHKRFGRLEVLKGVSLEARQGDVISMIGASGSGKSTFLRCINLRSEEHTAELQSLMRIPYAFFC